MSNKNKSKNLPVTQAPQDIMIQPEQSPVAIMQMAMNKNLDLDRVQKMLDIQKEWEKNEARKAYHEDMAIFKTEHITITKDKENKQYNSMYATHGNIVNTVTPVLSKYGFSHKFDIEQDTEGVKVTCIITHRKGHSDSSFMKAPLDKSGSKNAIQQIKSTRTYLKSATFEDVLGIAPVDDNFDDDGNNYNPVEYITPDQAIEISDLIKETSTPLESFLSWLGQGSYDIETVSGIPATHYEAAINGLKAKGRKNENN